MKFGESEERFWRGRSEVDRLLEEGFGGGRIGLKEEKKGRKSGRVVPSFDRYELEVLT